MASLDPSFRKSLTSDEQQALQGISTLAQDTRNRQWLLAHKVELFPVQETWDTYYHIPFDNTPKRNHTPVRFGLQFSDEAAKFRLDGAERAAMTFDSMTEDIFINRRRVNDPKTEISFGSVVSLLVHEFGHKLPSVGLTKNQNAINNLGAKLETFVQARSKSFETPKGKLITLNFKSAFYEQWLQRSLQKPTVDPLMILDEEGLIVFAENPQGVFDLTSEILKTFTDRTLAKIDLLPQYTWGKLNLVTADVLQFNATENGDIAFEFNAAHSQTWIPFMKTGAPDPRTFGFWKRVAPSFPPFTPDRNERRQTLIDLQKARPRVARSSFKTLKFQDASTDIKKVFVEWQANDFVAQYKLPTDFKRSWEGGALNFRPYLIVSLNGRRAEIPSTSSSSTNGVFEFRIPNLKSRGSGEIEVIGMELGPSKQNLAITGEARAQLLLKEQDRLKLDGSAQRVYLKQIEPTITEFERDQTVSLNFQSSSPLIAMNLLIEYDWTTDAGFGRQTTLSAQKWVSIDGASLKQSFVGNELHLEFNLGKIVDHQVQYAGYNTGASAGIKIKILDFEATNLDLVQSTSSISKRTDNSSQRLCRDLFR
ncbi:MAG: hypothetical protein EOP05_01975 [Proteobacteria bacterium]|nr:MAG: hypothetical protein EOP05_01975 [Pseudomonadota bacterium]